MTQVAPRRSFKICLVTISLANGGAERSCAMLSQMLANKGHQVYIALIKDEIDYPYKGELFNLGLLKKANETIFGRFRRFKKFRQFLKSEKFDVIVDHCPKNLRFREFFYDRYLYKNLPRIYVIHTSKREFALTSSPNSQVRIYNKNLINVAVSNYIKNEILLSSGVKKVTTIYNAFDKKWKENPAALPTGLQGKNYLLSYGRIDDSIKDFTFLIEAFSLSKVWEEEIHLVIMGDGDDLQKLEEKKSAVAGGSHISFIPFSAKPFPIISGARFVTLTSKYEGFPMVLVESLSLGTPVVSLDIVSGPSEIIKDRENGLLVKERSLPLFAQAIHNMCFDEALYQNCRQNAITSVEGFSMEKISEEWDQLLQNEL